MTGVVKIGCTALSGFDLPVFDNVRDMQLNVVPVPIGNILLNPRAPYQPASLTDVDADLFEAWWLQNQHGHLVTSGQVFRHEVEAAEADQAEHARPDDGA